MAQIITKKIKVAIIVHGLTLNGISKVVMNYVTRLSVDKFEIEILNNGSYDVSVLEYFHQLHIDVVNLPSKERHPFRQLIMLISELRRFKPDVVHVNGSSALMASELFAAWLLNVRVRIAHCHSDRGMHKILNYIMRPVARALSNTKLACSVPAGESVFRIGSFDVLPNAFDVRNFEFCRRSRREIRERYNIPFDAVVLGHVGRVNKIKNQQFAIDVFDEMCKKNGNLYAVLVGDGPDMDALRERVKMSPNIKKIVLTGSVLNPAPYYSAFDMLLFPSINEGLGISVLEAQASGLPCVISSSIPKEAELGGQILRIDPAESVSSWAEKSLKFISHLDHGTCRVSAPGIMKYDITHCAQSLEEFYEALDGSSAREVKGVRLVIE